MKSILNSIGKLFTYQSPAPLDGMRTFLRYKTSRELRQLAGTKSHYSKTIMINMIIDEIKDSNIT
tara:strand:+ start:407 stop:601 length:195 start_codon:yes stop_codon:yes gene_type:complete